MRSSTDLLVGGRRLRLAVVVLLAAAVLPVLGAPAWAGPGGSLEVAPGSPGFIGGGGWPAPSTVTLSVVDGLGNPQCPGLAPINAPTGGWESNPCDLEVGWTVTATDGVTTATVIIEDLQLLSGSVVSDTITVHLAVTDASLYTFGCGGDARVSVGALVEGQPPVAVRYLDGPGTTVLDFTKTTSCPDDDVGAGGSDTTDIIGAPQEAIFQLFDADGDRTQTARGIPFPMTDVGLVDVAAGQWHLRDSQTGELTSFYYGNPGDLPISGDWDGDGDATPGLYRQSDGFFYARNSNTQGPADAECFAGDPSDVPIVGDWDGDGDDNLGIYRPSEQMFYLFTITCTGSPMGAAQISLLFGNPGDKPVAGDWDGDGIDEVGLHRESTGFFYWRNTLDTGNASGEIFFGDPGDRFVAGDWGLIDDVDTPAIFRPSDQTFYFRHTLTQGVADSEFGSDDFGTGWLPVSGVFRLS